MDVENPGKMQKSFITGNKIVRNEETNRINRDKPIMNW